MKSAYKSKFSITVQDITKPPSAIIYSQESNIVVDILAGKIKTIGDISAIPLNKPEECGALIEAAVKAGNVTLSEQLLKRTKTVQFDRNFLYGLLTRAAFINGNTLLDLVKQYRPETQKIPIDLEVISAASSGDQERFQKSLEKCDSKSVRWNLVLETMINNNHLEVFRLALEKSDNQISFALRTEVLVCAAKNPDPTILEMVLAKFSTTYATSFQSDYWADKIHKAVINNDSQEKVSAVLKYFPNKLKILEKALQTDNEKVLVNNFGYFINQLDQVLAQIPQNEQERFIEDFGNKVSQAVDKVGNFAALKILQQLHGKIADMSNVQNIPIAFSSEEKRDSILGLSALHLVDKTLHHAVVEVTGRPSGKISQAKIVTEGLSAMPRDMIDKIIGHVGSR